MIAAWVLAAGLFAVPCGAQEAGKSETVSVPGSDIKFDMVSIPGGKFKMGSPADEAGRDADEGDVREVELKPFWMGKNEVTWAEFELFYSSPKEAAVDGVTRPTPGREFLGQVGLPGHFQEAKRPVICLRWHSAMGYCHFVSRKTGQLYRLPTEAEWEYACRVGADKPATDQAWFKDNSQERTREVGEKKPNALGLCDMLGNVWEYCLEPYAPPDFSPVLRGGAWNSPAKELRPANRQGIPEEWFGQDPNRPRSVWWLTGDYTQGMRLVRVADASDAKDREAYAEKIQVTFQGSKELTVKKGTSAEFFCRVTGEVKNAGDRALDELHVLIYYLDPKGKPHKVDIQGADKPGRATFAYVFPALVNSAMAGDHRQPMKPGESRKFTADLPQAFDGDDLVQLEKFGAQAIGVVFSR
jgi:formylglycine-generating enzyme required for sulfatase activity